jgi:CheY-like chemotaxis protein
MATRDGNLSATAALRTQTAVLRTLAHELRREGAAPDAVAGLQVQVVEESGRLASEIRDLASARASQSRLLGRQQPGRGDLREPISERRWRILIVDDDDGARSAIARWLEHDYEVITACDGLDGLDRAVQASPDIIIADVWMPKLDGVAMVDRMKRLDCLRETPVVFLTGQSEPASIAAGFSAGGHSYLTKPVDLDLLENEIRAALGRGT